MDSPATNVASSEKPGRWLQALHPEKLPLMVALGGVGLAALTVLLFNSPRVLDDNDPAAAAFVMKSQSVAKDLDSGFPHDLLPERIQLPQFPDPDELRRDSKQDQQEIQSLGFSLSNLKVENVTYHKPITTEVALAFPDAPIQLTPGILSLARFGEQAGPQGRAGHDGGWGGGGSCGENSSIIIDRGYSFPN